MSDRCYMSVTCRRQDRERFEDLGFHVEFDEDKDTPVIEMIDEEANYAHSEEMPSDIPYYGSYGAGDNYGPGSLVCDGKECQEVASGSHGFVLDWNHRFGLPTLKSMLRVRRYVKLERRVQKLFKALQAAQRREHLFSPDTDCCVKCGLHADDDAVAPTPCIR